MAKIFFISFNIRGMNDPNKVSFLKDFLKVNRVGICFIQETHIDSPAYVEELGNVFCSYFCYFTINSSKTRGVGILIDKNISHDLNVLNSQYDLDSRVLRVELKLNNILFNLVNIYAPNSENEHDWILFIVFMIFVQI